MKLISNQKLEHIGKILAEKKNKNETKAFNFAPLLYPTEMNHDKKARKGKEILEKLFSLL